MPCFRIAIAKDVDKVRGILPPLVLQTIEDTAIQMDEGYGVDRDPQCDDGGYELVITGWDGVTAEDLAQVAGCEPEGDIIENPKDWGGWQFAIFLMNNEFSVGLWLFPGWRTGPPESLRSLLDARVVAQQ